MAYPVLLEELILKCRQRSNLEVSSLSTSDAFSDDEITNEINTSLAEWYDLVRSTSWGGNYYRKRYNFTTTATTNSTPPVSPPPGSYYQLPNDFLSLISVDIAISNNLVISGRPYQEEQRNVFKFYPIGSWTWNQPIYYFLAQGQIFFIPGPIGQFQVQVNYCPIAPKLSRPGDSFDSVNSWEEFIVLDVGIKMLIKDGDTSTIPLLAERLEAQRARIKSLVPKRDMQASEMIHETMDSDSWEW
jgi:hypothetical protein